MRPVPFEMRQKLLGNLQVSSKGANPKLRIIATQSTTNTLLSESIHKNIPSASGDVALRQLEGEDEPSLAYAVCIDNGTANVYERLLPAELEKPWTQLFSLGTATECAVEFNGIWKLNSNKQWYSLETEQTPYIFYVNSDNLYVLKWNDQTTKIPLAEGVSCISACRAWQSTDQPLLDQGLIIGYIKSGVVFYRALCLQESGELVWETEREITELGAGNTSVSVFRTNDFRVGFITENNGEIKYVLSSRTYAGQSVRPETAYAQIEAECSITVKPIAYLSGYETGSFVLDGDKVYPEKDIVISSYMSEPVLKVSSVYRQSTSIYEINTNYPLTARGDISGYLQITPGAGEVIPEITDVTVSGNKITVTTDAPLSRSMPVTITLASGSGLFFTAPGTSYIPVPGISAYFPPESVTDDSPVLIAVPDIITLSAKLLSYSYSVNEENMVLNNSYTCILIATMVGSVPI